MSKKQTNLSWKVHLKLFIKANLNFFFKKETLKIPIVKPVTLNLS